MRLLTILLVLLTTAAGTSAQDSTRWDLQRCIDRALEMNNSLRQLGVQQSLQENQLQQSKWNRAPVINGSANHNYNVGRSIDPFTNTFSTQTFQSNSFSISAGLLLFDAGRVNNTIRSNHVGLEAMEYGRNAMENQISLSVATSYLLILQAEASLALNQDQLALTESQLDQAKKRVAAGRDNKASVLALEAQLAADRSALVNARNQIQLAYGQLMNLLQIPLDEEFAIEVPALSPMESEQPTARELLDVALLFYPDLMEARLLEEQAELQTRIARSALYPSISAYGNLGTVYSESGVEYNTSTVLMPIGYVAGTNEEVLSLVPVSTITEKSFNDQIRDNFGQSFGLSLSVPILNNYRNRTALDNAKLNQKLARLQTEARHNALRTEVTEAVTNQQAAVSSYQAALRSEEAQRLNYRFLQERYAAGLLTETELLQSKNNWRTAEVQRSNAAFELVFRNMIIAFYQGKPIQL